MLIRTIDGRCNNLDSDKSLWGSMSIQLRRYLPRITSLYKLETFLDGPSSRSLLEEGKLQIGKFDIYLLVALNKFLPKRHFAFEILPTTDRRRGGKGGGNGGSK